MRKNISDVIEAFRRGEARQHETCRTDGRVIWSYALPVAIRQDDGNVVVIYANSSRTTNGQINAIARSFPRCTRVDAIVLNPTPAGLVDAVGAVMESRK